MKRAQGIKFLLCRDPPLVREFIVPRVMFAGNVRSASLLKTIATAMLTFSSRKSSPTRDEISSEEKMTNIEAFFFGAMIAWTPSLLFVAWYLLRDVYGRTRRHSASFQRRGNPAG